MVRPAASAARYAGSFLYNVGMEIVDFDLMRLKEG